MEYLLFAFGFVIFLPFSIWVVVAGLQNTRFEKRQNDAKSLATKPTE